MPTASDGAYQLAVPSTPEQVATVRLFVGAVGRVAGLDEVTIEDAKLAVSEIATAIIGSGLSSVVETVAVAGDAVMTLRLSPWAPGMGEEEDFGALDIVTALFAGTSTEDGVVTIEVEASEQDD